MSTPHDAPVSLWPDADPVPSPTPATQSLVCPDCSGCLIPRINGESGQRFFGCETFPECRYTQSEEATQRRAANQPLVIGTDLRAEVRRSLPWPTRTTGPARRGRQWRRRSQRSWKNS